MNRRKNDPGRGLDDDAPRPILRLLPIPNEPEPVEPEPAGKGERVPPTRPATSPGTREPSSP